MTRIPVCLVGCGGMGTRHVAGFAALERTGIGNVDLVAVCDIREDNAQRAANEAERLIGRRPTIHTSIKSALADPAIVAFDVVTEAFTHIGIALPILEAGRHVLCEKPLALTVRSCRALIDAAARTGAVLATAENYRRDPPSRLAKAAVEGGLLGHIHLMQQFHVGGDDRIIITPWRHMKDKGTIALDMGCHLTDMMQFYLGEIESVSGIGLIAEPIRFRRERPEQDLPSYWARLKEMPETVTATGEDSLVATYTMKSGALAQITYLPSGPGHRWIQRSVHGRRGSLMAARDRTGGEVVLHRASGTIAGNALLGELPEFHLDEVTSRLFAGKVVYAPLDFSAADAALIAIEIHDFAEAIKNRRKPEVD
ncbi:MAG: Gfo/Idh/MocA family oxidoreductase, partial [Alphaproteobacteria bacterium]|nr:Gfo/Idh/MocA family oxidoreductase [Alphaproteobacteria bacterium]